MANSYKTPGVYVEEISTLPASVAQVETAIPAFIGYTQKADNIVKDDLILVPTKVSSLVEYELFFGAGPSYTYGPINLDVNNNIAPVTVTNKFFNYDSIRMFFANGGGDCYIVSVGLFTKPGAPLDTDFAAGLAVVKKFDEPTLLLFPDAALLSAANLGAVQVAALNQCADQNLMDRFTIMDVKETPGGNSIQYAADISTFRNNIGTRNLKYGAAYSPYLKVNLPKQVHYRDISTLVKKSGAAVTIKDLTDDIAIKALVDDLDSAFKSVDKINADITALIADPTLNSLASKYDALRTVWLGGNTAANFKPMMNFLYAIAKEVSDWVQTDVTNVSIKSTISNSAGSGSLFLAYQKLIALDRGATGAGTFPWATSIYLDPPMPPAGPAGFANLFGGGAPLPNAVFVGATTALRLTAGEPHVTAAAQEIFDAISAIVSSAAEKEATAEAAVYAEHSLYKKIIDTLTNELLVLPPSGAIAGIYADVDRSRGVWKAPANVSVTAVTALTQLIDNASQQELNVHPSTGKSINAIRAFTGKGILVWGARTLAGNDNEWRYVPVRRLFIMVEESIRKATEFVVFEPNDANTWTRVRGMINNFLTDLWRVGALAGAKPAHAFFVNVGLGETMTPQDILEGKLIIEIGMAAVRPAEFIILRFSHKLQES